MELFIKGNSRGHFSHGWLDTYHTFSFAEYRDPERIHFGALRVINEDVIAPGMGFGTHGHDNMEIITIPLTGSLAHKDSMDNSSTISAGEIQVMTAGSGIRHSEYNATADIPVHLLQIWIFPNKRELTPRYDQKYFSTLDKKNVWHTLIHPEGSDGALTIHQDAYFMMGTFEQGKTITYTTHQEGHGVFLFCLKGSIQIGEHILEEKDAIGVSDRENYAIEVLQEAQVLLIEVPMEVRW